MCILSYGLAENESRYFEFLLFSLNINLSAVEYDVVFVKIWKYKKYICICVYDYATDFIIFYYFNDSNIRVELLYEFLLMLIKMTV